VKSLIDIHVHAAAFPDGNNGCVMSPSFKKGLVVWFIKRKMGLKGVDPGTLNRQYVDRLVADMRRSRRLSGAVLLAFDGVYDEAGRLDLSRTTCLISNEYVADVVARFPDLLFLGASINPQRRDALDELDRVLKKGAKLIKILPNSQAFDPSHSRYRSFYRALADEKLALLAHVGAEHTFTVHDQDLGFPGKLQTALEEGTIVIGAHGCGSNAFIHGKFYATFFKLMTTYPNFYVDLSALSLPSAAGMLFYLRRHPEFFDRYLFGTDYPLSAYATTFVGRFGFASQCRLWRITNTFDKQAAILEGLGVTLQNETTKRLLQLSHN
jgi:predicted TIM-barrel fold metal-dependent hydrolase